MATQADFGESVEDMLTKLDTYREQLALVENALEQSSDEQLVKLKEGLQEVIKHTEDLVRYRNATAANDVQQSQKAKAKAAGSAHAAWIDRTCECFWENKWYNGVIQSIRKDERGIERCSVQMLGLGIVREYRINDVRLLKPPPPVQVKVGSLVHSIFIEDGLWYEAKVEEQTQKGYRVKFVEHGEMAEVKFDQVRLPDQKNKHILPNQKKNVKDVVTPGGWKIPENLLPQEDDTEKQKEWKRRKIHSLKTEQRKDRVEHGAKKEQHSWLKFKQKASTKSKTGFLTGKTKESIFKVPDNVNGKVGVVGSGKDMTKFVDRTKFTYNA